jgi:hypothetical protein
MPHIAKMIPSNYLKAGDLVADGENGEQDVTIADVREEELMGDGGERKLKWVAYFEELERRLVLNTTNLRKLAELCGSDVSEDWTGKRVRLYVTTVAFRGEEVQAIRIKRAPPDGRPSTKPSAVDAIPF